MNAHDDVPKVEKFCRRPRLVVQLYIQLECFPGPICRGMSCLNLQFQELKQPSAEFKPDGIKCAGALEQNNSASTSLKKGVVFS